MIWIIGAFVLGSLLVLGTIALVRARALPPDPRDTRGSDELDEAWKALSPRARAWIIRERENERSTKND